ncbi:hypothetical protein M5K25_003013 [Dendrobium thyrsiflorum]|uniref:Expansin-like EG45 domain-containing protein n=1 Tax=Dendrobium thyrsiflorum TaxID=117978 RepID=A0ABD0VQ44_DENTH
MKEETIIFAVPMLLFLASLASTSIGGYIPGKASFYAEPYHPSACNWNDNGTFIISVSDALWDNGNACGRKYVVWCTPVSEGIFQNCTDGDITVGYLVTVVDYCGHCNDLTMLLSQEIFSAMTNTENGSIQILYEEIFI